MKNVIKVFVQGETDWVSFEYSIEELNVRKDMRINLPATAASIGARLDGDNFNPLDEQSKLLIKEALANYVANLSTFEKLKTESYKYLFITIFRIKDKNTDGYCGRVAGALPNVVASNIASRHGESEFLSLLGLMKRNPHYKKDGYDKSSVYHLLMMSAAKLNIQFK